MANYRVCSGDLDVFISRNTPHEAARVAIMSLHNQNEIRLGLMISVSCENEEDYFIGTAGLVAKTGLHYNEN